MTPVNTRNSQVAKSSPAESRLKNIDWHTETMNSFWISLQTIKECLLKVPEINLKLGRTSVETSKKISRNFENISHQELEIYKDNLILVLKWGNDQTDRHTRNAKVLELMYRHPSNVSGKFRKLAHSELLT